MESRPDWPDLGWIIFINKRVGGETGDEQGLQTGGIDLNTSIDFEIKSHISYESP